MNRPAFSRLPVSVDLPLLLQALAAIDDGAWRSHFNTAYFAGDWSGVALISAADALTELSPGQGQPLQRAPWLRDARWQQALRVLSLEIVSARLLRLGPGGQIHEHRDYDLDGPEADLRLHIPLLSPPAVDFWLDGRRMPMTAGECWFLDLARPHRVDNRDTSARIHLVLDCRPGAWLAQMIAEGLPGTPEPDGSDSTLQRFQHLVAADQSLSATLQALHDPEAFIARTLELAAERGLPFSREELRAAMRHGRRQWNEQWNA
ncbi:aspartyl/asparaginyl beta-hydroxylase domain-containing protein [Pseudomonas sp. B2M1-30]|uniref:aspartyl/asparaginyl beta-hydroxylase domain-containing protein n=1 Tax=Pseudomonas TaxID=286 RepID=UPI0021C8A774|nr:MULTISPECIES: aspartyl/asparaginyl beta-hydroxylase domain-containing protein [Pseudomonas]MCU0118466.1 aspartyl/asparaginyl beta-hydroxylase domain-containing protein [Pseudomonas sp. B2M1-30]MCU7259496.1 aspartyl/asparaginyl beta-hydroxylase domain-containing protein [Pseudomonas koreensis]